MDTTEKILAETAALEPSMVALRRDLHKYAETGWLEMRTSSILARKLKDMGYEILVGDQVCKSDARMGVPSEEVLEKNYQRAVEQGGDPEYLPYTRGGHTGVIALLRCGEGPTVAMRFDIDGLGVVEENKEGHFPYDNGFRSVNEGMMHACGHDGHTTIGLGVAQVLMGIKEALHGTVKLIFQPAEEGVRGAKAIVEAGHLDDVDFFIGNHITNTVGDIDVFTGSAGSLATCKYDVVFRGLASHAGSAGHKGKNALVAACNAVVNLYAIPRHNKVTKLNVGTLHAGSGRNVIADEAKMEIELRGEDDEANEYMCAYAKRILQAAADMWDCTVEWKLMGAAQSMQSDEDLAKRIAETVTRELGLTCAKELFPGKGSEDCSYMMNRVQSRGGKATFMRTCMHLDGPAHSRGYNFDEGRLAKAVQIFCTAVCDLMK